MSSLNTNHVCCLCCSGELTTDFAPAAASCSCTAHLHCGAVGLNCASSLFHDRGPEHQPLHPCSHTVSAYLLHETHRHSHDFRTHPRLRNTGSPLPLPSIPPHAASTAPLFAHAPSFCCSFHSRGVCGRFPCDADGTLMPQCAHGLSSVDPAVCYAGTHPLLRRLCVPLSPCSHSVSM